MRRTADLLIVARPEAAPRERGGLIGKVQAIVYEHPGLHTRDIKKLLAREADGFQVSGALNKLKNEGTIVQDRTQRRVRWVKPGDGAPVRSDMHVDGWCRCGTSILFGSLATAEERARPRCSLFPFALRGAA